jgi:benzoate-CoA ligase family protein
MKVFIAGGGPAGLYAAYLIKKARPDAVITLVEQNPPDATFGFGVVFSDRALDFLRDDDPETHALITPAMETWTDLTINHAGKTISIDGIGFAAIGRLTLLALLQQRLTSVSVTPRFETALREPPDPDDYDLIIAADGVNSVIRAAYPAFGTTITPLTNKFVWYGTTKPFATLTQTFLRNGHGHFNVHHYRYAPDMSTFLVECDADTWHRAGFDAMSEAQSRETCEEIYASVLDGHRLISNRSLWRNFPVIWNERWHHRNIVLVGDALRTAHFSIGSGTRLALEDVIALVGALSGNDFDVARALPAYEAARRPIVEKLLAAANASAAWYENFAQQMQLSPWDLAWSYIQRSGRIDKDRLRNVSPGFVAGYEASRDRQTAATASTAIHDPVPIDTPGARAISFAIHERYNGSAIRFDNLAMGRGARTAVTGPAGMRTYAELCAEAAQVGNGLVRFGAKRGERVICLLDDTPTYPATIFGAMRGGLVPVLLNILTPPDLVRFYVEDSGARIAFLAQELLEKLGIEVFASAGIALIVVVGADKPIIGNGQAAVRVVSYEAFREHEPRTLAAADTHRDEMAFWMYSYGSTGKPKGVVHLHHDMAYSVESYARHILRLTQNDICFSVPKIFFAYGFGNSCSFPFAVGASSVLLPGRPEPRAVFDAVSNYKPTVFFGLPTLYTALIKDPAQASADLASVRLCVSAAEVLAAEVFHAWRARFGHEIVEGLGSTEVLHIYLSNTEQDKRLGSAGRPVPGYEINLVDLDGTPRTDNGVLMVRGPSSAPCYWNRPDKTADTMRGEWIWTGDRFDRDADDFYYFRGRADDLIKVSGQWVYPLEVELCLADHPWVKECAVLGLELPDRRMTLKAFVTLADGAAADEATTASLQAFIKSKLVPYKYPRLVEYLSELPKTGTGKIDRQALKSRPLGESRS